MINIPKGFLIETELSQEQLEILSKQIERFNYLSKNYGVISSPLVNDSGEIIFKEGTLIHGTGVFYYDKLTSISKSGILTGQAVGISEDCETFYCADFHRVDKDISARDYCINFKYNDGRCPFGEVRADNSKNIAFVIIPNEVNSEILSYDCYRDGTKESDITKSFVNLDGLPKSGSDRNKMASILYGVPHNFINGIVVGGKILDDKSKIEFLIENFPSCYIISAFGELIYNPSMDDHLRLDIVNLRREKCCLTRDNRKLMLAVNSYEKENVKLKENYDLLMKEMFMNCNSADIARVLIALSWQGNITEEYVDEIRKRYGR